MEYGAEAALHDVTLSVAPGEAVALVGPSGSGKTTLLRLLNGTLRPTRGEVWFDGRKLDQLDERELTRQRIRFGFVFQNAALFDSLTTGQNIQLGLSPEACRKHDAHSDPRVREAIEHVNLGPEVLHLLPSELSGGMRKRVAIDP